MRVLFSLFVFWSLTNARTIQFYIEPTQKVVPTYVQQLVEGTIERVQQGSRMRGSVSLIYDGGYYILVDTPSATDFQGKETMLRGIASRNIVPGEIQLVVTTHGHPDHFGQDNFFPNARHFFGSYEYSDDTFISTELKTSARMPLTRNVELWNTPGHTSQDVSILVRNVPCCGTVAVTGDLFYNEEDALNGTEWFADSWNPLVGKLNRDKIICEADYIIPGHGKLFKITDEMKMNAACDATNPDDSNEIFSDNGKKRDATVSFTYTYPTTTTTPATTLTAAIPATKTTTPFFITVEHLPEIQSAPEIQNLVNSVNDALPYVINKVLPSAANRLETHVKKVQENQENILAPVVETAAMQLSHLLKMESPATFNSTYPYTTYLKKAFHKLADDIPKLQTALNVDNISNLKEKVRMYRHPMMENVFKIFNSAYLTSKKTNQQREAI